MSRTKPVEASIQAVSPLSSLASSFGGSDLGGSALLPGAGGLAGLSACMLGEKHAKTRTTRSGIKKRFNAGPSNGDTSG